MAIRKSRALGCAPSLMDGTEYVYTANESLELPEEYSYVDYMSKILDQGQDPICVACSISAYINWKLNMETGEKEDHFKNIGQLKTFFYEAGGGPNGMTYKDALYHLRHKGIITKDRIVKIKEYSLANSILALKNAIIMNGPCLGALPVWDVTGKPEFWRRTRRTTQFYGGHAVSVVGWTKEGFIIRNSWGKYFGKDGYVILPYDEYSQAYEFWTII